MSKKRIVCFEFKEISLRTSGSREENPPIRVHERLEPDAALALICFFCKGQSFSIYPLLHIVGIGTRLSFFWVCFGGCRSPLRL